MKLLRRIIGSTTLILYALSGLALLAFTIPATGLTAMSVATGSMQPAISPGSLVIIHKTPLSELKVGDVITFRSLKEKNQTITHRIVGIEKKDRVPYFTTKGDANPINDPQIIGGRVVGRVAAALPFVGYAIDFMRSIWGLLLAIYIPALVVVIGEVRRLEAYYRAFRPFRLPWVKGQLFKPKLRHKLAAVAKVTVVCLIAAAGIAIPVLAAWVTNQVTLADNSINIAQTSHILFRRVDFQCAEDNTGLVNKLPSIVFHNPADQDTPTGNWYVESKDGRIVTFRPQTVFDSRDDYDIEPDLEAGVTYGGDFLALFDAEGNVIDAISWGADTTYLDPSLPTTLEGSVLRRLNVFFDTNTVADWAVSVEACGVSE